ncbi:MAG: hypothetical protein ND866_08055 [Pyrinomonadaceae bacterium]|nr:hypothetical protein [Pyrinomonadaceae bacterium]
MRGREATKATKAGKTNLQFVRERHTFIRRRRLLKSPRAGLQIIADRLNELPVLQHDAESRDYPPVLKEEYLGWKLAESIVSASSLSRARKTFMIHAVQHPVNMAVEAGKAHRHPIVSSRDAVGTVLWHLWLFYFHDREWKYLKRCPVCHRWFVDTSNNKAQIRCSSACTWQWWSRPRRKKMHHRTKGTKPPSAAHKQTVARVHKKGGKAHAKTHR